MQELERLIDIESKRCGLLLNWQSSQDPFWHYGIGLSDSHIFDTGRGLCPFLSDRAKLVVDIERIVFPPGKVIGRLKHAIHVFGSWDYNVLGWNCEHLARLIATGRPRSYQSAVIWMLCDLTPTGDHKSAARIFNDYLQANEPSLLTRER